METRWGVAICTNYRPYGVGLAGANYTLYFRSLNSRLQIRINSGSIGSINRGSSYSSCQDNPKG